MKMALARGRVEGAQQLLDELKAEQEALSAATSATATSSRHE